MGHRGATLARSCRPGSGRTRSKTRRPAIHEESRSSGPRACDVRLNMRKVTSRCHRLRKASNSTVGTPAFASSFNKRPNVRALGKRAPVSHNEMAASEQPITAESDSCLQNERVRNSFRWSPKDRSRSGSMSSGREMCSLAETTKRSSSHVFEAAFGASRRITLGCNATPGPANFCEIRRLSAVEIVNIVQTSCSLVTFRRSRP
jgi:hypothetical protein